MIASSRRLSRAHRALAASFLFIGLFHASRVGAQTVNPSCCDPSGSGCCGPFPDPCTLMYGAQGFVRDSVTGGPIVGAYVTVLGASTVTNADGEFLVNGTRDETCNIDYFFSLSVRAAGYQRYLSEFYTSGVFARGDIHLVPLPPPTPDTGEPTATPTPPSHCPALTPCPAGQRPRPCDSDPCRLGCGCEPCGECPDGQMLEPHVGFCKCVPGHTPTPLANLPDLVPSGVYLSGDPMLPECVDDPAEYVTRVVGIGVCVDNRGGVLSDAFDVAVDGNLLHFDGIRPGDAVCTGPVAHAIDVPVALIEVDVSDVVPESDESNNRRRLEVPFPTMPPLCTTLPRVEIGRVVGEPGETVTFDVVLRTRGDAIAFVEHAMTFEPETPIGRRGDGRPDCEPNADLVSGELVLLPAGCEGAECAAVHARIESLAGALPDAAVLYRCTAAIPDEPAETCHFPLGCAELSVGASAAAAAPAPCADGAIESAFAREPASFRFAITPEHPRVGDTVEVTVDVDADGGRVIYNLRGIEPVFAPINGTISRAHFGPVTYPLVAVEAGVASLVMSVSYESEFGCPGVTIHHRTGESSQPFLLEIAEAEPTETPTPGPPCPTATPVICPTGQTAICQYPPFVPCRECQCESCPACPAGWHFTRPNACDCSPDAGCPTPTPCAIGEQPRSCETDACGLGCGCETCGDCPDGQMLDPHFGPCRCIAEYTPTPLPIPENVPELVASGIYLAELPPLPECIDDPGEYITRNVGIGVCVDNRGGVDAGPFDVLLSGSTLRFDGVAAHDVACLGSASHAIDVPETEVEVDTADEVAEGDEGNNRQRLTVPLPAMPPVCSTLPRVEIGFARAEPGATVAFDATLRTRGDAIGFVDHLFGFDPETPIAARAGGAPDCEPNSDLVSAAFEFLPAGCSGAECSEVHARIESLAGALPDRATLYRCTATITTEPSDTCLHSLHCSNLTVGESAAGAAVQPCGDGWIESANPRPPATFSFTVEPEHPRVGDVVRLTIDVSAPGGLPSYHLSGIEPFLTIRAAPPSGSRFEPITYELLAAEAGVASVVVAVQYESVFGCPGVEYFAFTGDTSEPFEVEIAPGEASPTPTPPRSCPTATVPICPTDTVLRCETVPLEGCTECRCETCLPCPSGFTRVGQCDCARDAAEPPGDEAGATAGGGGASGCAIDGDRSAHDVGWWLAIAPLVLACARRFRRAGG